MTTKRSQRILSRYSRAWRYSPLKPNVVRSPEQTTIWGSISLISAIARSIRLGTKFGSPQWMSDRCAIVKVLPSRAMGRSVGRPRLPVPSAWVAEKIHDFQAYRGEGEPRFANDVELECAKLLDYYGIPWAYEPHTFVLEEDDEGRVVEAFTPDFFLPEQNLYLELTVMKQSLVTRKNRKLRKLRECYPDVNAKLFYRRDIERLAQRYRLDLAS